jgi:hypothetical protein
VQFGDELRLARLRRLHARCLDKAEQYPWALFVAAYSDNDYVAWEISPGWFPENRCNEYWQADYQIRRGERPPDERYMHNVAHVRFWNTAISESWICSENNSDDPVPDAIDAVYFDGMIWYGGYFDCGKAPQDQDYRDEPHHISDFMLLLRELGPELFATSDEGVWQACPVSGMGPYGIGRLYEVLAAERGFVVTEAKIGPFEQRWLAPNIFLALARAVEIFAEGSARGPSPKTPEIHAPRLTAPKSPKELAKIFNCSWDKLKPLLEGGKIRNRKLSSKSYQVMLDDMPADQP